MGGSRPSAPVTYMPTPAAPTLYKSVIPEADFARAADYLAQIRADRGVAERQRYQQVGTPAEIGARQAGIRAQEATSYAASLPKGSQYDQARQSAESRAQKASRAPISTVGGIDPNVFNQKDYESAAAAGYSDTEIKDWLESSGTKIGPVPQQKFGLSADRVVPTGMASRGDETATTPSWAVPTTGEQEAQTQRDEQAKQERILKAKELAKRVADSNTSKVT